MPRVSDMVHLIVDASMLRGEAQEVAEIGDAIQQMRLILTRY